MTCSSYQIFQTAPCNSPQMHVSKYPSVIYVQTKFSKIEQCAKKTQLFSMKFVQNESRRSILEFHTLFERNVWHKILFNLQNKKYQFSSMNKILIKILKNLHYFFLKYTSPTSCLIETSHYRKIRKNSSFLHSCENASKYKVGMECQLCFRLTFVVETSKAAEYANRSSLSVFPFLSLSLSLE